MTSLGFNILDPEGGLNDEAEGANEEVDASMKQQITTVRPKAVV